MSDYIWGVTVGLYAIGGLVGSLSTMFTNMWFGRRSNIMICTVFTMIGGIFSALAVNTGMVSFDHILIRQNLISFLTCKNFLQYIVGRIFVGIGSGLAGSCVPIYVSEIATKKTRGALGSFFELFLNFGILFTQVAGLYLSKVPDWRFLWVIPSVLALVQLLLLIFFTVECPRRLCANKEYEKARNALQKLRGDADIENEFNNLLEARKRDEHRRQMSIWEVISGKDKYVLVNTIYVMVLLAYNQIGGVGPMSVYSVSFFTKIFNGDTNMATNLSLIDASVNIVATLIAVFFMNKVGRKGFMLISTGGMTIACIGIVIGSSVATDRTGPLIIFSGKKSSPL
jgi:MFS family permease